MTEKISPELVRAMKELIATLDDKQCDQLKELVNLILLDVVKMHDETVKNALKIHLN